MRFARFAIPMLVLTFGGLGYVFFMTGNPRMLVQQHIKPYQAQMPLPPEGSVPTTQPFEPLPSEQAAAGMKCPLPATPANIAAGRTYYGYYCVSCHGQNGHGDGPVGAGFLPPPGGLRTDKIKAMSDGQLLRSMLIGPGHSPLRKNIAEQRAVLEYIVLPDHRWPLVLYVRSLGSQGN